MSREIELFLKESIAHARNLPLPECMAYLRGLLQLAGDVPEVAELRHLFVQLSECDRQLEFLQSPQLKLRLDGAAA